MRYALPLVLLLVAGCAARPAVVGSPVSPNGSSAPVSVPGVPASVALATAVLNGTVTYRQRVALRPGSTVVVRVEDLSGVPARVVAEQTIRPTQQVPIPFAIAYTPSRIDPGHRYGVRAEVRDEDGVLTWATATPAPVFTQGGPVDGVEVVVVQP